MLLRNRPLLIALLLVFAFIEARLVADLMTAGFDWRPLWGAPIVRGTMMDFTFTIIWATLWLFDTARRERRSPWAWLPLLLTFPTIALFLFSLTAPGPQRE